MLGAGIILLNNKNEVLLILRDNKVNIPYPGLWDIPGGHVENGETPDEAIKREMMEELEINDLGEIALFNFYKSDNLTDFIFWKKINLDVNEIDLQEGQEIKYFSLTQIRETKLAFNYNIVLEEFYNEIVKNV